MPRGINSLGKRKEPKTLLLLLFDFPNQALSENKLAARPFGFGIIIPHGQTVFWQPSRFSHRQRIGYQHGFLKSIFQPVFSIKLVAK